MNDKDNVLQVKAEENETWYPAPIHGFVIMETTPEEDRWNQFMYKIMQMPDDKFQRLMKFLDNEF